MASERFRLMLSQKSLRLMFSQRTIVPRSLSNVGKWNTTYAALAAEQLWGDQTTYQLAAEFLNDMDVVEDWGCGSGGFRLFCRTKYIGIDSSSSPFADQIADISSYLSTADGILLRHVLEHNVMWRRILANAVRSFGRKLCIVLFTPFENRTKIIEYDAAMDIVDISFAKKDLVRLLRGTQWTLMENIETDTQYGVEHIFFVERADRI
jgi:hypothetical protein